MKKKICICCKTNYTRSLQASYCQNCHDFLLGYIYQKLAGFSGNLKFVSNFLKENK